MCCGSMKGHALVKIILGVLLLLNAFVWPKMLGIDGWIEFVAILMIIIGIVKLFWHPCCCGKECTCGTGEKPAKKKK